MSHKNITITINENDVTDIITILTKGLRAIESEMMYFESEKRKKNLIEKWKIDKHIRRCKMVHRIITILTKKYTTDPIDINLKSFSDDFKRLLKEHGYKLIIDFE